MSAGKIHTPRLSLTLLVSLLSACASSPSQQATSGLPEYSPLPGHWQRDAQVDAAHALTRRWWQRFGSAELDALIARADVQSLDIAAAMSRVRQAQANARIAGAVLLPELAGSIEASRSRYVGDDNDNTLRDYSAGLNTRYELDFWGRHRALRDSALQTLNASRFDHDTVRLTLTAAVASNWLQMVALQERIGIAAQNLQSAERLLALIEARNRAGAATALEVAQQRGLVAGQRRNVAQLQQQGDDARVDIGILLGQAIPVDQSHSSLRDLVMAPINAGVPSALLTRRPDIARAEAELAAAEADVFAARRAMLPSLSLGAGITTGGNHLDLVFDDPVYSFAAALTAPIFNAGRLAATRDFSQARREELLAQYRSAIINAFGDVQRALNAVAGLDAQALAQTEELSQAEYALALAESRYRAGAETLLVLLDAQRSLYAAQDHAAQLKAERLQAQVALYKALGGGWDKSTQS